MKPIYLSLAALFALALLLRAAPLPTPDKLPVVKGLPDPLTLLDGTKVETAEQWKTKRAPELRELFQHYMYGKFPPAPKKVEAKVLFEDKKALGGKAVVREVELTVAPAPAPKLYLLLALPNEPAGRAPVFVGLNFSGNHTLLDDKRIHLPTTWMYPGYKGVKDNKATEAGRGQYKDTWPMDDIIARGYGVATIYNGDIDPDRKDVRGGIKPFIDPKGEAGTIAAWAWGVQRAVDYLLTRPDVDGKKIIATGHSRLGKTALLAGAFDTRIAMSIPLQAGCGGTAPNRVAKDAGRVERLADINKNFPHWFNDNFKKFNDEPARLPFDQHCLAALMAPRPVLFSNAVEDKWANPDGQFDMLVGADPVYRKLGVEGLAKKEKPAVGKLSAGRLGYWIRPGKHQMTRADWKTFMDYADIHLGKPGKKTAARKLSLLLIGQGPDGHPPKTHEYMDGLKVIQEELSGAEGITVTLVKADGAWKEGPELLGRCDAAVLFVAEGAAWLDREPARREALAAMLKRGGGLVVLHWAMGSKKAGPVKPFVELAGGCHGGPDRKYAVVDTQVSIADPAHPITRGLKGFKIKDEFYYKLKLAPGATPLVKADIDGEAHAVAWAYMPGPERGRAFGFSGLHFHANWKRAAYRKLIKQAVLWALGV
jgi:type 1 glutamine amidotransferase